MRIYLKKTIYMFLFLGSFLMVFVLNDGFSEKHLMLPNRLDTVLRTLFLYSNENDAVFKQTGFFITICWFLTFLFGYLFLMEPILGFSKTWRNLTLLRYKTKSKFFICNIIKFIIPCLILSAMLFGMIFLCVIITGCENLEFSQLSWALLTWVILNFFLYYTFISTMSFYIIIRFNDASAIIVSLFITFLFLLLSTRLKIISVLTMDTLESAQIGAIFIFIILLTINIILPIRAKKWDLL